jgi:DNA-binding response OmpR family regulator
MVSGAADLEDPSAAPPHGVRRVLAKPFTSHELLGAVVAVLGRS